MTVPIPEPFARLSEPQGREHTFRAAAAVAAEGELERTDTDVQLTRQARHRQMLVEPGAHVILRLEDMLD